MRNVFTGQEILTICLFVGSEQRYTRLKGMHKFESLNRMVGSVGELLKHLIVSHKPEDCGEGTLVVDSMPIMTCCGRNRKGKVSREVADKGYCSPLSKHSSAGLSIKQTFKRAQKCRSTAGLLIHGAGGQFVMTEPKSSQLLKTISPLHA